jgi:hypothetical protein
VGAGGSWRIRRPNAIGGVAAIEEITYRLTSINGDGIAMIDAEIRRLPLFEGDDPLPSDAGSARIWKAIDALALEDLDELAVARKLKPYVKGSFKSIRVLRAGLIGLVDEYRTDVDAAGKAVTDGGEEHPLALHMSQHLLVIDPRYAQTR